MYRRTKLTPSKDGWSLEMTDIDGIVTTETHECKGVLQALADAFIRQDEIRADLTHEVIVRARLPEQEIEELFSEGLRDKSNPLDWQALEFMTQFR